MAGLYKLAWECVSAVVEVPYVWNSGYPLTIEPTSCSNGK
jgi:hypothetical protein